MKKLIPILILISLAFDGFSNDSLKIESLEKKMSELSENVQEVKRDQNNYSIEKELLKETYSNNYDRIQIILTILFGIFSAIAFFGVRDVNSLKKEYKEELEKLLSLKSDFEAKSKSFDIEKGKFESKITEILEQNELQNKKIKVLELKEKIDQLIKNEAYSAALEYINLGIELITDDIDLLNKKALVLSRLNQFDAAQKSLEKALEIVPSDERILLNYIECLYFTKNMTIKNSILEKHQNLQELMKKRGLTKYFSILEKFSDPNMKEAEFKKHIKNSLSLTNNNDTNAIIGWDFADARFFIHYNSDNKKSEIMKEVIKYFEGRQTNSILLQTLNS